MKSSTYDPHVHKSIANIGQSIVSDMINVLDVNHVLRKNHVLIGLAAALNLDVIDMDGTLYLEGVVWDPYVNWHQLMPHLMYYQIDIIHTALFIRCEYRGEVLCDCCIGEFDGGRAKLQTRDDVAKRVGVLALVRYLKVGDIATGTKQLALQPTEGSLYDDVDHVWYLPINMRDLRPGQHVHFRNDEDTMTVLDCVMESSTDVGLRFYVINGHWRGVITDVDKGTGYLDGVLRYAGQTDEEWAQTIYRQWPTKARLIVLATKDEDEDDL